MKEMMNVRNLRVSYGPKEIISGVDLKLYEGELCALLGINGCGKTTLIHAVCGFIKSEGTITVTGLETGRMNEKVRAKYMSFIPQVLSNQDGRNVMDAVMMGYTPRLGFFENPSEEMAERALEIIREAGLGGKEKTDFGLLSQGEKQLCILARCMVQGAPVMLMDEPDSSLDFNNRHMMLGKISRIIKEKGYAGLISMHNPDYALGYCDRILIMDGGKITDEIRPTKDSAEEINGKLSKIYDGIEVWQKNGRFFVIKKEDDYGK